MPSPKKKTTTDKGVPDPSQKKIQFFPLRPIKSLLISDPEFQYVIKLGKNMQHLLPVNPDVIEEVHNAKKEHEDKLNYMKDIASTTNLDEEEREILLHKTGLEAKELLLIIKEHNIMRKSIELDKGKIEAALSSANKACFYWRKEDATKYAEWLIVQTTANRLLQKYLRSDGIHKVAEKEVDVCEIEITSTATTRKTDTVMIETTEGTIINVDEILPPAKKAKPDRKIIKTLRSTDKKYNHSEGYDYITHQAYKNQLNGGLQGKRQKLHGHGFEWDNGVLKCTLCNERFRQARSMDKHTKNRTHVENLNKKRQVIRNFIKDV